MADAFVPQGNRRDRQDNASNTGKFFGNEAERVRKSVTDLESKLAEFKTKHGGQLPDMNDRT